MPRWGLPWRRCGAPDGAVAASPAVQGCPRLRARGPVRPRRRIDVALPPGRTPAWCSRPAATRTPVRRAPDLARPRRRRWYRCGARRPGPRRAAPELRPIQEAPTPGARRVGPVGHRAVARQGRRRAACAKLLHMLVVLAASSPGPATARWACGRATPAAEDFVYVASGGGVQAHRPPPRARAARRGHPRGPDLSVEQLSADPRSSASRAPPSDELVLGVPRASATGCRLLRPHRDAGRHAFSTRTPASWSASASRRVAVAFASRRGEQRRLFARVVHALRPVFFPPPAASPSETDRERISAASPARGRSLAHLPPPPSRRPPFRRARPRARAAAARLRHARRSSPGRRRARPDDGQRPPVAARPATSSGPWSSTGVPAQGAERCARVRGHRRARHAARP
jgi:hypothetical protein